MRSMFVQTNPIVETTDIRDDYWQEIADQELIAPTRQTVSVILLHQINNAGQKSCQGHDSTTVFFFYFNLHL
uniref:Uncharacterized protein n=1 Tax=Arion vulgaris TaxID=1028688 RepID=A0A0B7B511_9EUPU